MMIGSKEWASIGEKKPWGRKRDRDGNGAAQESGRFEERGLYHEVDSGWFNL